MPKLERRFWDRDVTLANQVQCRITFADGTTLVGLVTDCCEAGARIGGIIPAQQIGAPVTLLFTFLSGEAVQYRASVIHVDTESSSFGVRYDSEPEPVKVYPPTA